MHYKNLAFAALAGIVLLSSCVKDLETKSVTDIRNAKLEEIKSQTALNNAKAASEKTLSEAEALLKAAQAEAQKAQAEYIKAQAAYQQALTEGALLDNQLKAAELEAALVQAEISKAQAQAQLERLAMELEKELLKAQKELLEAQAEYKSGLATAYVNATIALLNAQNELVQLKANLTSTEEELVDLQTTKEKQIAANNELIAAYEKIVAAYRENMGMTEEELAAKLKELNSLCLEKIVLYENANNSYADSEDKLDKARNGIYKYLIISSNNFVFDVHDENWNYSFFASVNPTYGNGIIKYSYSYDVDGNNVMVPVVSIPSSTWESENFFYSFEGGKEICLYYPYGLRTYGKAKILDPNAPATVAADAKEVIAKQHESNVANIQTDINMYEAKIAAAEKAVSEYDAETKALYEEKAELEKKSEEAYAAYQEANKPYTEYLAKHYTEEYSAWTTYTDAQNTRNNLESEVSNLQNNIFNLSNEDWGLIKNAEDNVAYQTSWVSTCSKEVETKTTAVEDAQEAYDDQFKVVEPLLAKKNEAYAAYREKELAYYAGTLTDYSKVEEAKAAYDTAKAAWATEDATLQNLKSDLTAAQGSLESAKSNLNYAKQALTSAEISLESYKSQLAKAESDLAKKEPELEAAKVAEKTALDAYNAAISARNPYEDKECAALEKANTEAWNKYIDADNSVGKVTEKISSIESTTKSVAYSYEDLNKKTTVTSSTYLTYYSIKNYYIADCSAYVEISKNQLASRNASFDDFNKQVDEWLAKLTSIVESESAYSADIDALNELENTTFELYKEYDAAGKAYNDVYAEITALESKADDIDNCLAEIEDLKKDNADITAITSKEQVVALIKTRIANKELEIEVLKKKVEDLKAALDAALAEEE